MLHLRQVHFCTRHVLHLKRMSTTQSYVNLSVDQDNIAVLTMNKPKVNSLCPDLLQQISDALDHVEKNNIKGVVFTSALPSMFSAGLDLKVLYKPDYKRITDLVIYLSAVVNKLLVSGYVTAAAINGHTSAGGCLLAALTEYRVMMDGNFTISFNDTALGIAPSPWILDLMSHIMGAKRAEFVVNSSQLCYPHDALEVGLIDDVVSSEEEAIEKCKQFIKKFDRIPPLARSITKQRIRAKVIKSWTEQQKISIDDEVKRYYDPQTQDTIRTLLESLKNKNK